MSAQDCWALLQIAQTSDQRAIKRAYATKLKTIDPDANPREFIALREAYESAQMRARYEISDNNVDDVSVSNAEFELDKDGETQDSLVLKVQTTQSLNPDQLSAHGDNIILDEAFYSISLDKDTINQEELGNSDGDILDELEDLLKSPWCNEDLLYDEETKLNKYFKYIPLERLDNDLDRFASIIAENIPASDVLVDIYFKYRISDVCHQHYCFADAILHNRIWENELRNHLFKCNPQMYQFYRDLKNPPAYSGISWLSYDTLNRTEYLLLWFEEFCPTVLKELDSKQCRLWRKKIKQGQQNKWQFVLFGKANRNRLWKTGLGGDLPKLDPSGVEPAPDELVRSPIAFAFLCVLPLVAALFIKATVVTKKVVEFSPSPSLRQQWSHLPHLQYDAETLALLDKIPVSQRMTSDPAKWGVVFSAALVLYLLFYIYSIPKKTRLMGGLALSWLLVVSLLSLGIIAL